MKQIKLFLRLCMGVYFRRKPFSRIFSQIYELFCCARLQQANGTVESICKVRHRCKLKNTKNKK